MCERSVHGHSLGHVAHRIAYCAFDQLFAQTRRSVCIVLRNKLDDFFEVSDCAVRDQEFEVHRGIISLTFSTGRTRPALTSSKPPSSKISRSPGIRPSRKV